MGNNDLSFNVVALDMASATFLRVAEQIDRFAAKMDHLDGKKATVEVNVKTDDATTAVSNFSGKFAAISAAVVAGALRVRVS